MRGLSPCAPLFSSPFFLCLVSALPAQGGAWETARRIAPPDTASEWFGSSLAGGEDLDGDGVPDLLVGDFAAGKVFLYSGATGELVTALDSPDADRFGERVAFVGDLDGDGVEDFAVRSSALVLEEGGVYVYSGATLQERFRIPAPADTRIEWAASMGAAGDWNGDGHEDLGISDWQFLRLYSGLDGTLLAQLGFGVGLSGKAFASLGDLDGDGRSEIAVGDSTVQVQESDRLWLLRGGAGAAVWTLLSEPGGTGFGASVAAVADLDGDSVPEILVGEPGYSTAETYSAGRVLLVSGATGSELASWTGERTLGSLGRQVLAPGDVDGDGVADILARGGPPVFISGATLQESTPFAGRQIAARPLARAGDVDGDGRAEVWGTYPGGADPLLLPAVVRLDWLPGLESSAEAIHASLGADAELRLDFPAAQAGGRLFWMLASASGTGPGTFLGLEVPLTEDEVFAAAAAGRAGRFLQPAIGRLNDGGDAWVRLHAGPGELAPLTGRTLWLAALVWNRTEGGTAVSVPVPLEILP